MLNSIIQLISLNFYKQHFKSINRTALACSQKNYIPENLQNKPWVCICTLTFLTCLGEILLCTYKNTNLNAINDTWYLPWYFGPGLQFSGITCMWGILSMYNRIQCIRGSLHIEWFLNKFFFVLTVYVTV